MKRCVWILIVMIGLLFFSNPGFGQCSICTRTAQQLGEKPAKGLNAGIIYLAATPFAIAGYVFYRWRKNNRLRNELPDE